MFSHVDVRNGFYGIVTYDDKGNETGFFEKGKEVRLDTVCQSLENGAVTWKVSFDYMGNRKPFSFERCRIAEKKLVSELQGQGADVTPKTFNCFIDSMRLQESQVVKYKSTFNNLGWIQLPINSGFEYCYRCSKLVGNRNAEYTGDLDLMPRGSKEGWIDMVNAEVIGRVPLETILLAALSAPIVGLIGMNGTTDNPIFHINFESGKGKSTVCYLAASVSGNPFDGKRKEYDKSKKQQIEKSSIYQSWGSTVKATISSHAGNRGVVAVLNELGKFQGNDMTTLIFNLSEGSDIRRLNTQLNTVVSEGFNTVFISCGEMSLIDRCKSKLEGIRTRVLEISVPMTDSAEHAIRIKEGCVKNNGFAAPMIAKYIIDNGGYDMVYQLYQEALLKLRSSPHEGISERFLEKFPAYLIVASQLAKETLGLVFHIDNVVDFCYKCVLDSHSEDGDISKSFDDVIQHLEVNQANFYDDGSIDYTPKVVWGRIRRTKKVENNKVLIREYCVFPNVLKTIMKELGYPNAITELKLWRDKGVLSCEAKRLDNKAKIKHFDSTSTRVYILQIWQDMPLKQTTKSKLVQLLMDDEESGEAVEIVEGEENNAE